MYNRWVFLRVVPYFDKPVRRVKIQTTSKNTQRYYTTKRLIRDLLSNTPNCMSICGRISRIFIYRECVTWQKNPKRKGIGPGNPANCLLVNSRRTRQTVFCVSTKPSLAQFISLFTGGKNRLSIVQITHRFKFFTRTFLSRPNVIIVNSFSCFLIGYL